MNKTFDCAFNLKAISESGSFSGYGSVFNVEDSYGDIVVPGAFAESLATQKSAGRMPSMLWQHRSAEVPGAYIDVREDTVGLWVEGQLALKTQRGAEAYELMSMKPRPAINGLSIGYMPREESYDKGTGINTVKKVDLWEVSLVTFPANDAARIQNIKSIEVIGDLKSAEKYLRDAGLSRKEAVAFIARVKGISQSYSDDVAMQEIVGAIKRHTYHPSH